MSYIKPVKTWRSLKWVLCACYGTSVVSDSIAHQAPLSMDSLSRNIIVGCRALLQGILPTQGLNLRLLWLLHCRQILYWWATGEALTMCYWVKEANLKRQYTVWFQLCMTFCKRQNCKKRAEKNCVVARGSGKGWREHWEFLG